MKFLEEIKGEAAIVRLAEIRNVPKEEIEAELQQIIDETWNSRDCDARSVQRKIFRGEKPSPALFIGRIAQYAKKQKSSPGL